MKRWWSCSWLKSNPTVRNRIHQWSDSRFTLRAPHNRNLPSKLIKWITNEWAKWKFSLFQLRATRKLFDMRRFSTTSSRGYCGWMQLTHETPCVYRLPDLQLLKIRVVHKNDGRRCYAQRPCVAGAYSLESPHR